MSTTKRTLLFVITLILTILSLACSSASVGTRVIVTDSTGIKQVIKPSDGFVSTISPTISTFEYDAKTFSLSEGVQGSTKDNAQVGMQIQVTIDPPQSDEDIKAFVTKFGLTPEDRKSRLEPLLHARVNTEAKNAIAEYQAYELLSNQENIQKKIFEALVPILRQQMWLKLESIQIVGRPDLPDQIENAAAAVVANQKAKEAAEADLARARVEAEKKQVEAQTYANPALLTLEKLRLELEIQRAKSDGIAKHQGSLTIVEGTPQLHLKQ
jgi:hypothetical protein